MSDLLTILDRIATALEVRNKRDIKLEPKAPESQERSYYGQGANDAKVHRPKQASRS